MRNSKPAGWMVAALLAGIAGVAGAASPTPYIPPPVEDFFRFPEVVSEVLSPEGGYLAILSTDANGRLRLIVGDTSKLTDMRQIAGYTNADVRGVHWVNEHRLVFSVVDLQQRISVGNGGLFAIDRDGTGERELIAPSFEFHQANTGSWVKSRVLPTTDIFFDTLPGETDDILVSDLKFQRADRYNIDRSVLLRLNTRTGESHPVLDSQPPQITRWYVDPDGEPRVGIAERDGLRKVYIRSASNADWRLADSRPPLSAGAPEPMLVGYDGQLFTKLDKMGVVYAADLDNPTRVDKPLIAVRDFDFQGWWEIDHRARKVLGVHFQTDAQGARWFDPTLAAAQKAIDDALPATVNRISCGNCLSSRYLLVEAQSDRQPSHYYLFDPTKGKITADTGEARPWIHARQMGQRDFIRYPARDGLSIPAYVNTPPGWHKGERRPLVVLVHGGPWVRGVSWEWDPEAQFLATRGYVVIQPIFRGSAGFGFNFFKAGWHQWGLAMQDDLVDAARWAVAQGYADPARIAIGGASYGGYATLMGLIRDPDVFRCGFELAGVTDLLSFRDFAWSDASDEIRGYSDVVLIGDPEKDRAQLIEASPIHSADRLLQPVLMAQGADDVRVPIIQGTAMRDAVMRTNKSAQWVAYADEGHGLTKEADRFDYWKRVAALLEPCLNGPAAGSAGKPGAQ